MCDEKHVSWKDEDGILEPYIIDKDVKINLKHGRSGDVVPFKVWI